MTAAMLKLTARAVGSDTTIVGQPAKQVAPLTEVRAAATTVAWFTCATPVPWLSAARAMPGVASTAAEAASATRRLAASG
jgi:hypothetical protein